jgi:hypothetical protein
MTVPGVRVKPVSSRRNRVGTGRIKLEMYIYLDTNIWNALCDQNVDPKSMVTALAAKSSAIVFGSHNVFELAKTFMPVTEEATARGATLFAYVAKFLDLGIPIIRENMETLQLEAQAFAAGGGFVNPFLYKRLVRNLMN